MTLQEVADRFGVDVSTVRGWVKRGLLPAERFGRRFWMVDREAVERFTPPPSGRPPRQK